MKWKNIIPKAPWSGGVYKRNNHPNEKNIKKGYRKEIVKKKGIYDLNSGNRKHT